MGFRRRVFRASDLRKVPDENPPHPLDKPLRIGNYCVLASGGPTMIIVDDAPLLSGHYADYVCCAWCTDRNIAREVWFSRSMLRRCVRI